METDDDDDLEDDYDDEDEDDVDDEEEDEEDLVSYSTGKRKTKKTDLSNNESANRRSPSGGTGTGSKTTLRPPHMSLMNSYRQSWKSRHNHFSRHSDIKPKEEKRKNLSDVTPNKHTLQRINGWKVI